MKIGNPSSRILNLATPNLVLEQKPPVFQRNRGCAAVRIEGGNGVVFSDNKWVKTHKANNWVSDFRFKF
ncbi:hypothetical protein SLEP1_g12377 [Rubroshorea leprosula]|uniref:Uncharacterized protein n=1 Tax=Rubroshorea leprosula TaxID=152421 RepID=A0AAV5INQ7_9ROSI|nr:hypothetical protein SLEP1_g12377 [Rubroshorea leprosula]